MKTRIGLTIMLVGALSGACDPVASPDGENADANSTVAATRAASHIPASGTFTQTAINSLDVRNAGPNTILNQTSEGTISGTLSGDFDDKLEVVIHPNGRFNAHFTISCVCTVEGRQGVLNIVASDTGELVTPDLARFTGRAVIKGGSGELSGLRGVLRIAGTVDVATGLSTYDYSGTIRFRP